MSDTLLEKSKAAYEASEEQKRLSKLYPELLREKAETERREYLEDAIYDLSNDVQSAISNYQTALDARNKAVSELLKSYTILAEAKSFKDVCNRLWSKAEQLATAKMQLRGESLDRQRLIGETQQVLMDARIHPLGQFEIDSHDYQKFLAVLSETLPNFQVRYPPGEQPRFLTVGPDGKSRYEY